MWFKPRGIRLSPRPVITIQMRTRRSNTLGWFSESVWHGRERDGESLSEINICAEHLQHDVYEIADTLIHEMVHYANALRGIEDCKSNQYHNKHFKRECENVGLICRRSGSQGWADTELTPELKRLTDEFGLGEAIEMFRGPLAPLGTRTVDDHRPKKQKLAKWSCACPVNVRVAWSTRFDACCNICGQLFYRK